MSAIVRPRVLQVCTIPATAASFLRHWNPVLTDRGYEISLATGATSPVGALPLFAPVLTVPWGRSLSPATLISAFLELRRHLTQRHYDIVHLHTPIAAAVGRLVLLSLRHRRSPKVVYTAHGYHFGRRIQGISRLRQLAFRAVEYSLAPACDAIVLVNREDWELTVPWRTARRQVVTVIPGVGVKLKVLEEGMTVHSREDLRDELDLGNDVALLMVGELNVNKGHADALNALSIAHRKDVSLLILGEGPLRNSLEAQAQQLGVSHRCHFLGQHPDVGRFLAAADGALITSRREGYSTFAQEAVAANLPVVAADVRGVSDVVATTCSFLFSPGDVTRLAMALDRWEQWTPSQPRALEMDAGKPGVHDPDSIATMYADLYDTLLANPCASSG